MICVKHIAYDAQLVTCDRICINSKALNDVFISLALYIYFLFLSVIQLFRKRKSEIKKERESVCVCVVANGHYIIEVQFSFTRLFYHRAESLVQYDPCLHFVCNVCSA